MDRSGIAYWDALAARWRISYPLAPSAEDLHRYQTEAAQCADASIEQAGAFKVLMLGVTAAIANMAWPSGTQLLAIDWSAAMIAALWPQPQLPGSGIAGVARGDWRALPLADASLDFVIGDGCYTALGTPDAALQLNREMQRVLRTGGRVSLRCFCRPERAMVIDELFEQLLGGRLRNLDLFRWLLTMAVQGDAAGGVRLSEVWKHWHARVPDPAIWAEKLGWTFDAVANFERWAHLDSSYWFPTLSELRALAAEGFVERSVLTPGYEFGELFPMLNLQRR